MQKLTLGTREQLLAGTFVAALMAPSLATAITPHAEVDLGIPDLASLRVGAYVSARTSVELYVSNVIFNWLIGFGVTGYLLGTTQDGGPPPHSLIVRGSAGFNPTASPLRLDSGGERIGSAVIVHAGYAYTAASGFSLRTGLGALLLWEDGPSGGPSLIVGVGWRF